MTEQLDVFATAAEDPRKLLTERRGMYLMINAIAKQADWIEQNARRLNIDANDVVRVATTGIIEGKVKIFPADNVPTHATDEDVINAVE